MNKKVIISSDSTCDLSKELVEKFKVKIFPLNIVRDTETLFDGVDIHLADVFEYKKATNKLIKTAAPSTFQLEEHIKSIGSDQEIVHFSISSEFSSAFNNMRLVSLDYENVYPIDSRNLSTGIGLLVIKACELRDQGLSAKQIKEEIDELKSKVDASFIIDTLEYLHKGGRCSSVAALGANLLKLKPCIEVRNGKMDVGKKYRGKLSDVHKNYIEEAFSDFSDIDDTRVFVTHTFLDENDQTLLGAIEKVKEYPFKEILVTQAGCSVGVHCGPSTLGVLFVRKSEVIKQK